MAKKSKVMRNEQRRAVVERYAERRSELKRIIADSTAEPAVRRAAQVELSNQPRDASATRLRNRDVVDGRPRGHLRKAGVSRIRFREMAHRGELPGIAKASW
ncbi:30S ribosomal protein S14 [Gordonia neofelifaecis]|uniref:Small ribosomal subunit protein uS14 n=1 Tax=Gordonia neofelifaecis NRRL B-59395 TaxID=644548 RepID=F1YIY0_9ACTN|nr:30S ribosomal protein S14 [Gordonia neofelifaecis]EGD55427.1 30S ribosomal protein S14 [Gordonia neofelifaecis NRRL B-59395]